MKAMAGQTEAMPVPTEMPAPAVPAPEGMSAPAGLAAPAVLPVPTDEQMSEAQQQEVPSSEPDTEPTVKDLLIMMKDMMKSYESRIMDMQKKLEESKGKEHKTKEDEDTLKPIHVKDLKLPEEYDGSASGFMEWHSRFKTMLENRNGHWSTLLKAVEEHGDKRIKNVEQVKKELLDKGQDMIGEQIEKYATQMFIYLSSYTKGIVHTRVLKGKEGEVFDIYLDILNKRKEY